MPEDDLCFHISFHKVTWVTQMTSSCMLVPVEHCASSVVHYISSQQILGPSSHVKIDRSILYSLKRETEWISHPWPVKMLLGQSYHWQMRFFRKYYLISYYQIIGNNFSWKPKLVHCNYIQWIKFYDQAV